MTSKYVICLLKIYLLIKLVNCQFTSDPPSILINIPIIPNDPMPFVDDIPIPKNMEQLPPPEIYSLHVESRIKHRYAQTLVTSRVANPANKSQEVQFTVVLPETAFISGFKMEIKGKVYKAYIKEKEEAKQIYQNAVQSGSAAAHVEVSARDSNQFTVSVNIEPNSKVTFNLTYEELLTRILGTYTHAINLNPGQLVRDLSVDVYISENKPISKLHVPELQSGNEVNPEKEGTENSLAQIEWPSKNKTKVHIRYAPTLDQQKLISKEKDEEYLGGQLRVQYDVENTNPGGEILVNEGYFVHFFAPSDLPPLRKTAIFVLDVSGSMEGRKLEQMKQAMNTILDDLPPTDYFNIIEFSYSVTVWNLDTLSASAVFQPESPAEGLYWFTKADGISTTTPSPTTPFPDDFDVPAYPATPEYKLKAKDVINKMRAGGGTNIHGALKTALMVSKVGFKNLATNNTKSNDNKSTDPAKTSTVTTPATAETNVEGTAEKITETSTLQSTNPATESATTKKPDTPVVPEPIIIFLTDGDATVGYTQPSKIFSMVKELNSPKCAIFSLAFGEGADFSFLRKLSLANSGFARNIYEAADAALQLNNFYKQVASPLLSNITFNYLPGQVTNNSITTKDFHTLFLGSELVVAGKMANPQKLEAQVFGLSVEGPVEFDLLAPRNTFDVIDEGDNFTNESDESDESTKDDLTESPIEKTEKKKKKSQKVPTLERLWAYLTIKQLLDKKHVLDNELDSSSDTTPPKTEIVDVKTQALRLALKYSFVTPLTSLVVVKPNSSSVPVDSEKLQNTQHKYFTTTAGFGAPGTPVLPLSLPPASSFYRPMFAGASSFGIHSSGGYSPLAATSFAEKMDTVDIAYEYTPQQYSLEDVIWLDDIINKDNETVTLPLGVNGTKQEYRIGLNKTNTDNKEFQECNSPVTTDSQSKSHCRHLVHCILPEIVPNVTEYIRYFCPITGGYAGVCCPDEETEQTVTLPTTTEVITDTASDMTTILSTAEQDKTNPVRETTEANVHPTTV